eukprot:TRINITY_DN5462_c0_g1_i3.p1 TRINITY_DN5462_c0_g1~~TRINITY_DN5462_c0_g1_i3.p1  ORF type:complete len:579 (+),score=130.13 TRINITY_DN5462_c0_g1_i3:50-1786(+)
MKRNAEEMDKDATISPMFTESVTTYPPPFNVVTSNSPHITSIHDYQAMWLESVQDPESFWGRMALENLTWFTPFDKVSSGGFEDGDIAWFLNGELNVSYNCLDRHIEERGDQIAIISEGDEPTEVTKLTYKQLLKETCKFANVLKSLGLRKGDCAALYMPNCPEAAIAMLACARIGVVHSVVFAGFSAESLAARVNDAKCKVIITSDELKRGGKVVPLKKTVDEALKHCPTILNCIVLQKTKGNVSMIPDRDIWWHDAVINQRPFCPPERMNSEDTLFLLYTSGSTGAPKGMLHTQGGYLLYASITHKYAFDIQLGDVYACVADVGWITGHSYVVYGPLCNGTTTVMFESVPTYPTPARYWEMVEKHRITQLYTAPTAIRTLMTFGNEHVKKHDRSSLRILGSVGEPINPEAWKWYYEVVGEERCAIVDTFWQTESGGHLLTPLPAATPTKPGSATLPFFGIHPVVLSNEGQVLEGNEVSGVLAICKPWPGIARTVYNNHLRYLNTYLHVYRGYYFTGDGVTRDSDGYYWISGRVDDVINVSGHRMGSAEVESALVSHPKCAESAVVGVPHDIKGYST